MSSSQAAAKKKKENKELTASSLLANESIANASLLTHLIFPSYSVNIAFGANFQEEIGEYRSLSSFELMLLFSEVIPWEGRRFFILLQRLWCLPVIERVKSPLQDAKDAKWEKWEKRKDQRDE